MRFDRGRFTTILALALWACAPSGIEMGPTAVVTPDGLHKVDWGVFESEFERPGTNLARFKRILLHPVAFSYTAGNRPAAPASQEDTEAMRRIFEQAIGSALELRGYTMASGPGPDVLQIDATVVDLPLTPPQIAPDSTTFEGESTQVLVLADLRDSQTGLVLFRVSQPEQTAVYASRSDPASFYSNMRELFRRWSSLLGELIAKSSTG